MDPVVNFGAFEDLTDADIRAMELIGYDTVPEPAMGGFVVIVAIGLLARASGARRRAYRPQPPTTTLQQSTYPRSRSKSWKYSGYVLFTHPGSLIRTPADLVPARAKLIAIR